MSKAAVQIYVRLIAFVFVVTGLAAFAGVIVSLVSMGGMAGGMSGIAFAPILIYSGTGACIWVASDALATLIHVGEE